MQTTRMQLLHWSYRSVTDLGFTPSSGIRCMCCYIQRMWLTSKPIMTMNSHFCHLKEQTIQTKPTTIKKMSVQRHSVTFAKNQTEEKALEEEQAWRSKITIDLK